MKSGIDNGRRYDNGLRWSAARLGSVLAAILIMASLADAVFAATYYVDGACGVSGNGQGLTCATSPGGAGAFSDLQAGVNALSGPGDVLFVRGVHASFDGRYTADRISISGKQGTASSPIILQPYGYPSAPETVYIESTLPATWTQCTTSTCSGAPSVSETWFTTKSNDGSNRAYWAQKPNGSITPRKTGLADLTAQYDAYSCEACNTLYVRWGTTLPAKTYVNYSNNGNGFVVANCSNVTIQGFTFRASIRAGVQVNYPNTNVVINDNKFFYINDSANGSGRPLTAHDSTNIVITNNEFAYSSSEPLHMQAGDTGRMTGRIEGNWIHDIGDRTVLGPGTGGTPNCTTFTSNTPGPGSTLGDFSGFVVAANVFERCYDSTAILFESHVDGMIVRDNIIRQVPLAFKFSPDNGAQSEHTNNNKIYNNIVYDLVSGSHNGAGNCFLLTGNNEIKNNIIWNNTCAGIGNLGVESQAGANNVNNQFYNNIFARAGSGDLVRAAQALTFQNNLLWNGSTSGRFGIISGANVNCGTGGNKCGNPNFKDQAGADFHILSTSPAVSAASSTGPPAGRTVDICNPRAKLAAKPDYGDCQTLTGTWDIGADELSGSNPIQASLSLSDPSPVAAGTVTVTLTASAQVVSIPGPLTLSESDGSSINISLSGAVPGRVFTGVFAVDTSVADGTGTFSLPAGSLVDGSGGTGNTITDVNGVPGASIVIDRTAPAAPSNLRTGG